MQTALILGATSTVAIELAKQLAEREYTLILAARKCERLNPLKSNLELHFNNEVILLEFDVTKFDTHDDFYKSLVTKPDVVICAFGSLGVQDELQNNWKRTEDLINVNYLGAVSILNIIANDFENRGHGIIVGISSVAGLRGRRSNYIYGSAKAAFTAYLSGLRNRLSSSKVHVITILPGFIKSKMTEGIKTPKFITASPADVAQSIIRSIEKKKDVVYILWYWKYIMLVIQLIPEKYFKRLNL